MVSDAAATAQQYARLVVAEYVDTDDPATNAVVDQMVAALDAHGLLRLPERVPVGEAVARLRAAWRAAGGVVPDADVLNDVYCEPPEQPPG